MRSTKLFPAVAVLVFGGLFATSQASAQGLYLGGSVGKSDIDDSITSGLITSGPVDGKDTGYKIFGGYQINQNFGVELGYVDLGKVTYSGFSGTSPVTNGTVEATGFNISAVGSVPLNPSFALFGKIGMFVWEAKANDITGGSPFSAKEDGTDVSFGFGLSYNFTKNVSARVEWERFKMDSENASLLSVGIAYRF